jgi:hypothetical protein
MLKHVIAGSAILVFLVAASVSAQPLPDPAQCTWDRILGSSPKNCVVSAPYRYRFTGTLRDSAGAPIADYPPCDLRLDFASCNAPSSRLYTAINPDAASDANGVVVWEANLTFGGADPCRVLILARLPGLPWATLAMIDQHLGLSTSCPEGPVVIDGGIRSPDENGDHCLTLADLAIFACEFSRCQCTPGNTVRRDYEGDLGPQFVGVPTLSGLGTFVVHYTAPPTSCATPACSPPPMPCP